MIKEKSEYPSARLAEEKIIAELKKAGAGEKGLYLGICQPAFPLEANLAGICLFLEGGYSVCRFSHLALGALCGAYYDSRIANASLNGSLNPCAHHIHAHAKYATIVSGYDHVDLLAANHVLEDRRDIIYLVIICIYIFLCAGHVK
jgi:hypothetical protein